MRILVGDSNQTKIKDLGVSSICFQPDVCWFDISMDKPFCMGRRESIGNLITKIEHIELETMSDFFEMFVEGCQFKPMEA